MAKGSKTTAWMLDEGTAISSDGGHIPGVPGLWKPGVAVSPEAFGMGVGEFRDLVSSLSLPLVEVSVSESEARVSFDRPDSMLDSQPESLSFQGVPVAADEGDRVAADQEAARSALESFAERSQEEAV